MLGERNECTFGFPKKDERGITGSSLWGRRDKMKFDKPREREFMTMTISHNDECGTILELSEEYSVIPARMSIEPMMLREADVPFSLVIIAEGLDGISLGSGCAEIGVNSAK